MSEKHLPIMGGGFDRIVCDLDGTAWVRERMCHIEERHGDQYCTCCGEMVGTCDPASELYISGNAVELWNHCPNCGAKVMRQ